MTKKQISDILEEWSNEFHRDYQDSYNKDLNAGHYRDLLDEVITRMDALNVAVKRKWYKI